MEARASARIDGGGRRDQAAQDESGSSFPSATFLIPNPIRRPARLLPLSFLLVIAAGSGLLMLPLATADGSAAPWLTALFTAVSASCVTGLVVVDTASYWSPFGQAVILLLIQLGGFGIMTAATLLGLMVNHSLRLRMRLITQVEMHALVLGDVRSVARLVLAVTIAVELLIAVLLMLRLHLAHDMALAAAAWNGLFHAVSAFNNAGFSIHSSNLSGYAGDGWMLLPVMLAIVTGGIGFPVLHDLQLRWRDPRHWSLHTRLTLTGTAVLLLGGSAGVLLFEWSNPLTLGPMTMFERLLSATFASVSARTAGFNSIDIGALTQESLALHYLLMFVGGGSAGTAGGVKVGTVMVLVLMLIAEIRSRADAQAFGRRASPAVQRQAITVLFLGSALVVAGTMVLLIATDHALDVVVFEVISAFGTVGLSTGITADLPPLAQLTLALLMYAGRVGTVTLAAALALGVREVTYRYPEEHPIVG